MQDLLIKLALAPVLFAQGAYVLRVTPKLPEATGPRDGVSESTSRTNEPLRLLIIGDSAAAGVGVQTQNDALTGQLTQTLSTDFHVTWKLIARSGWTTDALIQHLKTLPDTPFDVVVTSLGVNDVLTGKAPDKWRQSQIELINLLREKFDAPQIILTHVPPMHIFPALPQPLRWFLGRGAHRLNRELESLVPQIPGCQTLSIELPPGSDLMASDGFHPGAAGYALWAKEVAALILNSPRNP